LIIRGDLARCLICASGSLVDQWQDELKDSGVDRHGNRRVISKHVHFIEIDEKGEMRNAGYAPYLDYTPIS
jgi:hypothetical protein